MKCYIEEKIKKSGLRKGFIAEQLEISPQQLRKWMKGEYYPPANQLFKLAKILSCKVDEMYDFEGE
jgi:putative transcriptional regulator